MSTLKTLTERLPIIVIATIKLTCLHVILVKPVKLSFVCESDVLILKMGDSKIVRLFRLNGSRITIITSHVYNDLTSDWELLKRFNCVSYFDECVCCVINGDNLYVFNDGRREESSSGSRINLRSGEHKSIEHPKLYFMELAVVDNHVYALGFFGSNENERVVLRYSADNNTWIFVSRSTQHYWRPSCAVTSQSNSIFVAGGMDSSNKPCSLVECFDRSTRKWTKLPNMNRNRVYFTLTIIDGSLYAIDRKITTAERYDFQRKVWENVSISGRRAKMFFSSATVQDRLYAIEQASGQFYKIDVDANGRKLRLVSLSNGNSLLGNGHYQLLSKS